MNVIYYIAEKDLEALNSGAEVYATSSGSSKTTVMVILPFSGVIKLSGASFSFTIRLTEEYMKSEALKNK
jgi:ABC-type sulfate transport system permease component